MKDKLKFITFFLLGFCWGGLKAQQAVTAAGGDATGSGGTVSYSIGQVADNANTGSNASENQGVQQPYEFFTKVGIDEYKDITLEMSAYPNPAISFINLKVDNQNYGNLSFQLYDMNGKLIIMQKISSTETTIPMESLSAATYLLTITDFKKVIKSFQIIKNK